MYVLTIRQPWALLIVAGRKTEEFRSWQTAFRGRFLVHAGQGIDWSCPADLARHLPPQSTWAKGAIIGSVELTDCVPEPEGGFRWLLAAPKQLPTPYAVKGRLGFWTAPGDFLRAYEGQL